MDISIQNTLDALKRHHFEALYFDTAAEAKEKVLGMIPADASVGVGGSVTVRKMGLVTALEERGNRVFDHGKPGLTPEEKQNITRAQLTSDIFLSSSNAVTEKGELVNIDGAGNRVAAMTFGPHKVIIVVGKNKIVPDVEAGLERIKAIAGPMNAKRLNLDTPCAVTGYCQDCNSPSRICNVTLITRRKPWRVEMMVVIMGEEMGF